MGKVIVRPTPTLRLKYVLYFEVVFREGKTFTTCKTIVSVTPGFKYDFGASSTAFVRRTGGGIRLRGSAMRLFKAFNAGLKVRE